MCPHDDFNILIYKNGVIVRECVKCQEIEIKTEHWVTGDDILQVLRELSKMSEGKDANNK